MENNRSGSCLKQRLARVFRSPPFLLRSSCKPSNSAAANLSSTSSSRALLQNAAPAVGEPVFVPHSSNPQPRLDEDLDDSFLRLLSLAAPDDDNHRHRRRAFDLTGGCRPTRSSQLPSVIVKNSKWKSSKTRKKERRVRETGGYYETGGDGDGRTCPPASPSSPSKNSTHDYCFNNGTPEEEHDEMKRIAKRKTNKKKKKKKKKLASNAYGFTSSSSNDELGFFSTEEEEEEEEEGLKGEETETFFSSRSFSSDYSSEFYQNPNKNKKKMKKKITKKKTKKSISKSISDKWGVCKEFHPLVSVTSSSSGKTITKEEKEEEIEKKGFAVEKKSSDPYSDFRSSMVEMIIERQIFGTEDLERLLESYLSLNSPRHHPVILQAFSDIWVVLFDH